MDLTRDVLERSHADIVKKSFAHNHVHRSIVYVQYESIP